MKLKIVFAAILVMLATASAEFYVSVDKAQYTSDETPRLVIRSYDRYYYYKEEFPPGERRELIHFVVEVNKVNPFDESDYELVQTLEAEETDYGEETVVWLDGLGAGKYYVGVSDDYETRSVFFTKSDLGLVVKYNPYDSDVDAFVYALDLVTGETLSGVDVRAVDSDGDVLASSRTDGNGMAWLEVSGESFMVVGQKGDNVATVDGRMYEEESSYDDYLVYIYTDRPVYRPLQTVHGKAIVFERKGNDYEVAANRNVEVIIRDSKGNTVYDENLESNEYGGVEFEYVLGDEPPLGHYSANVIEPRTIRSGNAGYYSFKVEEYEKPEFKITITPLKNLFKPGEDIEARVKVEYYFGEPVQNADVAFRLQRGYTYWPCVRGWGCFYEPAYYGGDDAGVMTEEVELVAAMETRIAPPYWEEPDYDDERYELTTDEFGEAIISVEAPDVKYMTYYALVVTARDESRKTVTEQAQVRVGPSRLNIYMNADKWSYAPGDTVEVRVLTVEYDEDPIPYVELDINIYEMGESSWLWKDETGRLVDSFEITTDDEGKAEFEFTAGRKDTHYRIKAIAEYDGDEVEREMYVWVSERGAYEYIVIEAGEDEYEVGDTAEITMETPHDGYALVTFEGTDEILKSEVVRISGRESKLNVELTSDYAPQFTVYALMLSESEHNIADTGQGYVRATDPAKVVTVELSPEKEVYGPGETMRLDIRTRDSQGNPVSAELSLAMVDASIFAIEQPTQQSIEDYVANRYVRSRMSTQYSWGYGYHYGYRGMPEPSALGGEMLDFEEAPAELMEKEAAVQEYAPSRMRKYFPDTAYWNAFLRTDWMGSVRVEVTVPDSLTAWNMSSVAVTKDSKVGSGSEAVAATKKLLARLEVPRFITQGDELLVSAVVHNYLNDDATVSVKLEVEGLELMDSPGREIFLARNSVDRVDWRVKAGDCCSARISVYALSREESDAMELTIPVIPHGVVESYYVSGVTDSVDEFTLHLPGNIIDGATEAKLTASPSIAASMLTSLDYLTGYPYGCVEQTMSKFLPDVIVAQTIKDLDLEEPELIQELPEMVNKGLQKLANYQHPDGSWGWWYDDDDNLHMTAYVMYGLTIAKASGFDVGEEMYSSGMDSLKEQISESSSPTDVLYAAFVLSEAGEVSTARANAREFDVDDLTAQEKAYYVLVTGEGLDKLLGESECNEAFCHFTGKGWHYSWVSNDVETTAYALRAMVREDPDNENIPKVIAWLMSKRQDRGWYDTKDTAEALGAIAEYLKASKELEPDYEARVYVNGKLVEQFSVTKESILESTEVDLEPHLATGDNDVRVEKTGEGKLYYSSSLIYYEKNDDIERKDVEGLRIRRSYSDSEVDSGDYVTVTLEIDNDGGYEYVVIEDRLPAGAKVIEEEEQRGYYYGYWHYNRMEVRDEKVVFFFRYLPEETEIKYKLRAEIPGEYEIMPASAWMMYTPSLRAHTSEDALEITEFVRLYVPRIDVRPDIIVFGIEAMKVGDESVSGTVTLSVRDSGGNTVAEKTQSLTVTGATAETTVEIPVALDEGEGYIVRYSFANVAGKILDSGEKAVQAGVEEEAVFGVSIPEGFTMTPENLTALLLTIGVGFIIVVVGIAWLISRHGMI
jgi:uncharacterized protein YfaS (alpha-2-macroglobulin family)